MVNEPVIVVGSGIIGLSIAWRAAELGVPVKVVDQSDAPRGASWVAAGMLAPVTEIVFGEEGLLTLNLESLRRYPGFLQDLSDATGCTFPPKGPGTLLVALDGDQSRVLRRTQDHQLSLGLDIQWLSPDEARSLEPALAPGVRGAILASSDWSLDPRSVLAALQEAAAAAGVEFIRGVKADRLRTGENPAVFMSGDWHECSEVVLAAGAWSTQIEGVPEHIKNALRPVKGQIIRLSCLQAEPGPIGHVIRTEDVYLVPRSDGSIALGATVEEKGFDRSVTAGAMLELLEAAAEVVPGVREMQVDEMSASSRPCTPDNRPLLGRVEPGLIVATGHYRNGVLLAPITADAIAELLAKGQTPAEIEEYAPGRFT